jgi:hypothetical protein
MNANAFGGNLVELISRNFGGMPFIQGSLRVVWRAELQMHAQSLERDGRKSTELKEI